jgi:MFS family permease
VSKTAVAPAAVGAPSAPVQSGASFAALRHPAYRWYASTQMVANLGDNVEHVISYWVIWQAFHSPMLAGFAVIAHWLPSLLLSVHLGQLAERYDCRKIILIGQTLIMAVSLSWGLLFLTGTLQVWHAVVLLLCHGLAGSIQGPASQLIIHDIVGPKQLASAIRLNATARQLVILFGPAVGGVLMLVVGAPVGMLLNVLFYIPLSIWLIRFSPFTGHGRDSARAPAPSDLRWLEAFHVLRGLSGNRPVLAMVALGGASSLLVGNAFQAQMPGFAQDLAADTTGVSYSILLGSSAAGAFLGGLLLELTGALRPGVRSAIVTAALWCVVLMGFAWSRSYPVAVALMFVAGMLNLAFLAMAQTLVQLMAPADQRGRIVGLFNMFAFGLRVGSGVTVGLMGSIIGIHWALGLSAAALLVVTLGLLGLTWGDGGRAAVPAPASRSAGT